MAATYIWKVLFVMQLCVGVLSCTTQADNKKSGKKKETSSYANTDMYDLASPKVIHLPQVLDEISGIAYYAADTSIFAITDEEGVLYKISLNNPKGRIHYWTFDDPDDYEDLVMKDSVFYVLESDGDINRLVFKDDKIHVDKYNFFTSDANVNEFESMIIDSVHKKINIICKECQDDKKDKVTTYVFEDSSLKFRTNVEVNTEPMARALKDKSSIALRASAAGVHPLNGDIYVVSSITKSLTIFDKNFNFKNVIALDPKIYKQPEGLTFTPEGHLIISNEFADKGQANLLLMRNKLYEKK